MYNNSRTGNYPSVNVITFVTHPYFGTTPIISLLWKKCYICLRSSSVLELGLWSSLVRPDCSCLKKMHWCPTLHGWKNYSSSAQHFFTSYLDSSPKPLHMHNINLSRSLSWPVSLYTTSPPVSRDSGNNFGHFSVSFLRVGSCISELHAIILSGTQILKVKSWISDCCIFRPAFECCTLQTLVKITIFDTYLTTFV